jgi:hypothetical protein
MFWYDVTNPICMRDMDRCWAYNNAYIPLAMFKMGWSTPFNS